MKNIKLIIEYDGTNYAGWQRQSNALAVQEVIETALLKITGQPTTVIGSSRTDSGVHARGQVANFFTSSKIPPQRFSNAINSLIPRDIRVCNSVEVPYGFHSRYDAIGKRYRYSLYIHPHGPAIGRSYYYHISYKPDIALMVEAVKYIKGTHDFSAFQAAGSRIKDTVRTIYDAKLSWNEPYLYFDIYGNGFLYNMIRIIMGTLIMVGKKKILPDDVKDIIMDGDRSMAGFTAPAMGLCLEKVYYQEIILDTLGHMY